MKSSVLSTALLISSGSTLAVEIEEFTSLQDQSESFVRSTCGGFVRNQDATTAGEIELFDVCRTMVQSANQANGDQFNSELSRDLDADELGGAFQNIVPEETLAPINIASNTSSINLAAINARLGKIKVGGGAGDDDLFSSTRLGFFINGMGGFGETDQTAELDASEFDTKGVIAGFDYKLTEDLIVGVAGSYSFFDLDFDQNIDVAGGGIDSDNYMLGVYGTYGLGDLYIDGVFNYGWNEFDISRAAFLDSNNELVPVLNRTALANPDGEYFSASLASGYNFHYGSFNYGPYARVAYFETEIDSYIETGAGALDLNVSEHKADSLESVVGIQFSYAFSQSFGVLVPHVKGEWHHEFKNSQRVFDITYVNDPRQNIYQSNSGNPDRNFFNVSAGLSANLKHGIQAFFNYETILGLSNIDVHNFTAGIRMEL